MMPHGPSSSATGSTPNYDSPKAAALASERIMKNLAPFKDPTGANIHEVEAKHAALDTQLVKPDGNRADSLPRSRLVVPPSSRPPVARPQPKGVKPSGSTGPLVQNAMTSEAPPPLTPSPNCSGYFLQPVSSYVSHTPCTYRNSGRLQMRWMDTVLDEGNLEGKILCPNPKCKAKLGNYDWSGLQCNCCWVTPVRAIFFVRDVLLKVGGQGFCVHKSKVDEVW